MNACNCVLIAILVLYKKIIFTLTKLLPDFLKNQEHNSSDRQLAAILFADIVGYTSLMQADEAHTFQIIKRYQIILNSAAQSFNGQVLKNYGDGSLMTFPNSLNAVKAAKQIQEQAKKDVTVPLRIGIHVGKFILEKGDIYGNNVNLASRIESLGITGAILFSKNIFQKIKDHPEFKVQSVGSFNFKNVKEPMEVFALANEGFPIPKREEMQGKLKTSKNKAPTNWQIPAFVILLLTIAFFLWNNNNNNNTSHLNTINPSIAVLPFEDRSPDKNQEYFGDGISEEILNTLATLKELKVAGRTSSFSFKGKEATIAEIGKALKVNHILEGSVKKQGDKIRITAQLINVENGFNIWSEKYDRDFDDIFAIQDELAKSIGEALLDELAPEQIVKLKNDGPLNSKAYELFLNGKYIHWNVFRGTKDLETFQESESLFKQAIQLDSTYGLAYAGLADLYDTHMSNLRSEKNSIEYKKYEALSQQASDIAFQLNPELSYINTVRGYVQRARGDIFAAFTSFVKGCQLSPNNPDALYGLAYFYNRELGLQYEALSIIDRIKKIDPLYKPGLTESIICNINTGNVEQAIIDGQKLLEYDPDYLVAMRHIFMNYFYANKKEEAREILKKIIQLDSTQDRHTKLWVGLLQDDKQYIDRIRKEGSPFSKFEIHSFYGETEMAEKELKRHLEKIFKERPKDITVRKNSYLYYSKSKRFENHQNKNWFQKIIVPEKQLYEYVKKQFPLAKEVFEKLKN